MTDQTLSSSSSSYSDSPYDSSHQIDPDQMVSHQVFTRIVAPTLGSILSTILFFAQYKSFRDAQVLGSTGKINILPILMLHTNCVLWTAYGFILGAYALIPINILGVLVTTFYCFLFYSVSSPKQRKQLEIILFVNDTIAMCWIGFVTYALPPLNVKQVVPLGVVANIYNIAFYAAPLTTIYSILLEKSTASLSFPLTIMSFACAVFWGCFGIGHGDPFVYIPNGLGVLFSGIQIILFAVFWKNKGENKHNLPHNSSSTPLPYGPQVDEDDFEATLDVPPSSLSPPSPSPSSPSVRSKTDVALQSA
eukprot:TRINITY_DN2779_c0_g2_i1.p1 TRINITY_DN2779_c0_g2~~TRINITY_DN2779_c0_g2_i1.p1  ORF type:complete len:306 (+),score=87.52 TRINITY_DN2779_c0_g2_i1:230-1147(+)